MMRKLISLAIVLVMALFVVGCGEEQKQPNSTPDAVSTAEPNQADPTAQPQSQSTAASNREQETELKIMLEGMEEAMPVILHQGDRYSIYIPKEGWRMETDSDIGVYEEEWISTVNDDVKLKVVYLNGKNLQQAQEWLRADKNDYELVEDANGGLSGQDKEDHDYLDAHFYTLGNDTYVVMCKYPEEAAEGFGSRLNALADTFELDQ